MKQPILFRRNTYDVLHIFDPIYRMNWYVFYGDSLQNAINGFARTIGIEPWERAPGPNAHFAAYDPMWHGCLWFEKKRPPPETIAHECFHATLYLFERLAMKGPTRKTEEVFTYYMEWLIRLIASKGKAE